MAAFETPWTKRLRRDLREMEALRNDSTVLDFEAFGDPPDRYVVTFKGRGLEKKDGDVGFRDKHKAEIRMTLDYPRVPPQVRWLTPIHHPNIWGAGTVCLRDFWSPLRSRLVDLVAILWDMARLHILNPRSAYTAGTDASREWTDLEMRFGPFPVDERRLDDLAPPPAPTDEPEPGIFIMGVRKKGRIRLADHEERALLEAAGWAGATFDRTAEEFAEDWGPGWREDRDARFRARGMLPYGLDRYIFDDGGRARFVRDRVSDVLDDILLFRRLKGLVSEGSVELPDPVRGLLEGGAR